MIIPTIFETCRPRADVLRGAITEADFAADLVLTCESKAFNCKMSVWQDRQR